MRCPMMIPANEIMSTWIECFGVFSKTSTPNSSIFCAIAVEIARNTQIGINNRIYLLVMLIMLGIACLIFCENGSDLK